MSRPKPKFRIGRYARIVGCASNPEANGQVVMLVDGPEWFEGETVERPNGMWQEIPPGWVYRTDIGTKPDWAHESRLQTCGEPARRAAWGEIEMDTGWNPVMLSQPCSRSTAVQLAPAEIPYRES